MAWHQPYGGIRFSSGTMPTDRGFIGERNDGVTGLGCFNARYYDPLAGQFVSPDANLPGDGFNPWGLPRYAYAEGNPISRSAVRTAIELAPAESFKTIGIDAG